MPVTKSSTSSKKKPSIQEYYYGLGKRKTAVARVRLYKNGKGELTVNEKTGKTYFPVKELLEVINSPLKLTSLAKKFDISVKVDGGGSTAQADAIRHGIARALLDFDGELRPTLKKAGFLTRDSRTKERKKPGLKRARRAPQFSKR
ncbi:30S ribosomal protein S9 [Candidatus Peregrinibacteria bacterium]|nr:30S ribosomal protein S9 [Candidatus Peregrinibacteria bacterium]